MPKNDGEKVRPEIKSNQTGATLGLIFGPAGGGGLPDTGRFWLMPIYLTRRSPRRGAADEHPLKIGPWAPLGRFCELRGRFWRGSKNRCFFDRPLGG